MHLEVMPEKLGNVYFMLKKNYEEDACRTIISWLQERFFNM